MFNCGKGEYNDAERPEPEGFKMYLYNNQSIVEDYLLSPPRAGKCVTGSKRGKTWHSAKRRITRNLMPRAGKHATNATMRVCQGFH